MASHDPIENSCIMVSMWGKILNVFTVSCVCVGGGGGLGLSGFFGFLGLGLVYNGFHPVPSTHSIHWLGRQPSCHIAHIVQLTLCIDFLGKK